MLGRSVTERPVHGDIPNGAVDCIDSCAGDKKRERLGGLVDAPDGERGILRDREHIFAAVDEVWKRISGVNVSDHASVLKCIDKLYEQLTAECTVALSIFPGECSRTRAIYSHSRNRSAAVPDAISPHRHRRITRCCQLRRSRNRTCRRERSRGIRRDRCLKV